MPTTDDKAQEYRRWILSNQSDDFSIEKGDGDNLLVKSEVADGRVSFYDVDGYIVVELCLERKRDGVSIFFLHFELENLDRAKDLFREMTSALDDEMHKDQRHILLCCTCGMTTTFFANKLNEFASEHGLGYDFCAKSIVEAKSSGHSFEAVLLAPQVGHQLKEVRETLPGVVVLELPASVFGSYDAYAAMNLLLEALKERRVAAKSDLRFARDFDRTKSVLSISYVLRSDEPTMGYLVLDKGEEKLSGRLVRSDYNLETAFEDLFAALRMQGYTPESFDAIGIALPGVFYHGVLRFGKEQLQYASDESRTDISIYLRERLGVPVYVDNNARAAAAGCYVSQTEWDDLAFHAQPIGLVACDEGYVLDGVPRRGRDGFAGNTRLVASRLNLSMSLDEAVWRYDGVRELVACYISAAICTVAPKAIFVWCDFLPDMDELRKELEKTLPREVIPELVAVSDYDGMTLMGELALCLQRLAKKE